MAAKSQHALLTQELMLVKARIGKQISVIEKAAAKKVPGGIDPYEMQYADGKYVMPELLQAHASVLNALALLRVDRK